MLSNKPVIPFYTLESLEDFVIDGEMPGGFLTAALKNDLSRTFNRADNHNLKGIPGLVAFLYNYTPSRCWGSCEDVEAWHAKGGLRRIEPDSIEPVRKRFRAYEAEHYETATA